MRFILNNAKEGDVRTKERFLFWPKRIGNEIRVLERARWEETMIFIQRGMLYQDIWKATKWLNL